MRFHISFFRIVSSMWSKEKGRGLALYRLRRTVRKYHSCYTIPIGRGKLPTVSLRSRYLTVKVIEQMAKHIEADRR